MIMIFKALFEINLREEDEWILCLTFLNKNIEIIKKQFKDLWKIVDDSKFDSSGGVTLYFIQKSVFLLLINY